MYEQPRKDAGIREPLLLTSRQTAKLLNISERTLYSLTRTGEIPVIRIGRAVRYSLDDLREWIARNSQKSC